MTTQRTWTLMGVSLAAIVLFFILRERWGLRGGAWTE